jgi:hypothetical protein
MSSESRKAARPQRDEPLSAEESVRLLAELHAHLPAGRDTSWIREAMEHRGASLSSATIDEMLATMDREGCSICGQDPNAHRHQAHEREERRPGEPSVVGSKNGEHSSFDCPYCGATHAPLDRGWLPEHLPRRTYAECCGGGWYKIVADGRSPSAKAQRTNRPSGRKR